MLFYGGAYENGKTRSYQLFLQNIGKLAFVH